MDFKQYLMGLEWFSFSTYPSQGSNVYLHLQSEVDEVHKFIKVQNFNAVRFEPRDFFEKLNINGIHWKVSWLPCESVNEFE